jgi:phage shock protein A
MAMFDDLQRLFKESLAAFRAELGKHEPVDEIAELLTSMRRELVAARAAIPALEADAERARRELLRDRAELEQCERRGRLAEKIGDAETVAVANEWATRYRERVAVLEKKVVAMEAETELRKREAAEMQKRFQTAEANRFSMVDALTRDRARQRRQANQRETGAAFDDFSRFEERIGGNVSVDDILRELDDSGPTPPPGPDPVSVEERLRELKRQLGQT